MTAGSKRISYGIVRWSINVSASLLCSRTSS